MEISTHNFGDVYSIAVVSFYAGNKRYCVPHTRFLLHGIGFDITTPTRFNEHSLDERVKGSRLDRETIASIIAGATEGRKIDEAQLREAIQIYYGMQVWDKNGIPRESKLQELDLDWIEREVYKIRKMIPDRLSFT